uniref:Uncharacterized protein n=1 Tax=Physcomitrium patens TaxID=3218 RepID=A0A2K1IBN8_PHYPA|nr:hypothetical protein PHYPA_030184 [Physcomitrium patens]
MHCDFSGVLLLVQESLVWILKQSLCVGFVSIEAFTVREMCVP